MKSKASLIVIAVLFLFSTHLSAQVPTVTETKTITGAWNPIGKITSKSSQISYSPTTYYLGKIYPTPDSSTIVARSYCQYNLSSIPTNATITNVTVNYSTLSSSYSFKLTLVSSINPTNYQAAWSAIGGGSTMNSGISYGSGSFNSSGIKSAIQNNLSTRTLILGALGENETANDSYSSTLSVSLIVTYNRPAQLLSFVARNDLHGSDGGSIGVGINASPTSHPSPYTFTAYETQTINFTAYDNQSINGQTWLFNDSEAPNNKSNWKENLFGNTQPRGNTQSISYTASVADNGASFIAYLKTYVAPTFQNNFVSLGNGGIIMVKNNQRNSPSSADAVVEGNDISATAEYQVINGIEYLFSVWSNGSSLASTTFDPGSNVTYTAYFTGRPYKGGINFGFDLRQGMPIKMHWTDNPNTNVSYKIWRCTNYLHGIAYDSTLLATVQRGVQTYTDNDYIYTGNVNDAAIWYDVREYYSVEGTTSLPSWSGTKGELQPKIKASGDNLAAGEIKEYSLACYPNPFNPSTKINYQLPKDGLVTLKVYNELGEEVKTLVNQYQTSGIYNVDFNASNLSTGVYFYKLQAGDFVSIKKMLLLK